ncbi:hypothetical protein [Segatella copri]|uniref:hypothetical protein n=1 Tax=Segatella copri TaxID=165179 RepID=UPI0012916569|nr:hypothetical protein [Segatella copri]MQM91817.1 hypothetical protein [Segatella copri]MQM96751.1 hypothetical protein [Segatella copri]MQN03960.1 hypothetical protein [Segatella copri]MQO38627.1 hypothetical protein [Segatella copri]
MNKESKSKFNLWLSERPESFLPSDEARMFDLVNTLYETEGSVCIDEIFSEFTKSHPAYSKEEEMRLSDKWEEQILLIMRFLDWKKQIKK